jgi:hypothetical protein
MGGAACKKIIINGGRIMLNTADIHDAAVKADTEGGYLENDAKIVELFNEMEDLSFKALRLYLEGQGFKGPWPKSMQ